MRSVVRATAIALGLAITIVVSACSQDRGVFVQLGYPITVGDTFMSSYDGIAAIQLGYSHPILGAAVVKPSLAYDRYSNPRLITTRVYSARLALGFPVGILRSLSVAPEVGAGYTRMRFDVEIAATETTRYYFDGFHTWVSLTAAVAVTDLVRFGTLLGYHAVFLEPPDNGGNSGYNRQLHSLVSGVSLEVRF